MKISFLSRPGCHLCDDALEDLNRFLAEEEVDAEVEVLDIEQDDELHRRYLERIPVLLLEGEPVSELAFDFEEMNAAIGAHLQGQG